MTAYTLGHALAQIEERGAVPNIGQIDGVVKTDLERLVRQGRLRKYRGYWNTLSPDFGIGPLKTIYLGPLAANENQARAAS